MTFTIHQMLNLRSFAKHHRLNLSICTQQTSVEM